MNPTEAKNLANANGYEFYWSRQEQAYTCYPKDLSVQDNSFHVKSQLARMTAETFKRCYLSGVHDA